MRLLLDTHTFFWWVSDASELSITAREAMERPESTIFVSAVSAIELAIKVRIGKWPDAEWIIPELSDLILREGFRPLPVFVEHALLAGSHSSGHRDPFDRLLAAQAEIDGLVLISNDRAFQTFPGLNVLW